MYGFCVAHNSISRIVHECCDAGFDEYLAEASAEWKAVAAEFSSLGNFHRTFGAIDWKHVAIRCPRNGGSLYFNYKGFQSIILFALVDANYRYMWVVVGINGSSSDAQILNQSQLRSGIIDGTLQDPAAEPLPGDDRPMAYFLIGDNAFACGS